MLLKASLGVLLVVRLVLGLSLVVIRTQLSYPSKRLMADTRSALREPVLQENSMPAIAVCGSLVERGQPQVSVDSSRDSTHLHNATPAPTVPSSPSFVPLATIAAAQHQASNAPGPMSTFLPHSRGKSNPILKFSQG